MQRKREYVSYYHSIIFAFKGQEILGMSQDQHSCAFREEEEEDEGGSYWGKGGESGGREKEESRENSRGISELEMKAEAFSIYQRDYGV